MKLHPLVVAGSLIVSGAAGGVTGYLAFSSFVEKQVNAAISKADIGGAVANEVAEARRVNLGESAGPRIEVTSGLDEGDLVIIRGNERLRPGAQVTIR